MPKLRRGGETPGNEGKEPRLLLLGPGRGLTAFADAIKGNHSVNDRCCNIYQYYFHRFAFLYTYKFTNFRATTNSNRQGRPAGECKFF